MDRVNACFFKFYLPPILYGFLILLISSFPIRTLDLKIGFQIDKLLHLVEYCLFSVLVIRAFKNSPSRILRNNRLLLTIIFVSFYGFADEVYQSFVPNRDSSIFDFLFDSIGAVSGSLFYSVREIHRF